MTTNLKVVIVATILLLSSIVLVVWKGWLLSGLSIILWLFLIVIYSKAYLKEHKRMNNG